jgi:hypothetical protein
MKRTNLPIVGEAESLFLGDVGDEEVVEDEPGRGRVCVQLINGD